MSETTTNPALEAEQAATTITADALNEVTADLVEKVNSGVAEPDPTPVDPRLGALASLESRALAAIRSLRVEDLAKVVAELIAIMRA